MNVNHMKVVIVVSVFVLILSACTSGSTMKGMNHSAMNMGSGNDSNTASKADTDVTADAIPVLNGPEITLTAAPSQLDTGSGKKLTVWSYNNSVPGPQIRVKKGETVRITLKNRLDVPTSIHWHGIPVPNEMDGIPGVTQNAVQPGESFVYEFKTDVPGTYW